ERDSAFDADLERAAGLRAGDRWKEAGDALDQAATRLPSPSAEQRRRLERARADLDLARELDRVRLDKVLDRSEVRSPRADPAYESAFARAGVGRLADDPRGVAARVAASAVRENLRAALDDWASTTDQPGRRTWVLDVARRVDPDSPHNRYRDP